MLFLFILLILIFGYLAWIYNRFIKNKNRIQDAWANIDVFLKQRYELIPALVTIVKGYAAHEKDVFENIAKLRTDAQQTPEDSIHQQIEIANSFQKSFEKIQIIAEAYPELKANTTFLDLQHQLSEIEETLSRSRRYYNGAVKINKEFAQTFPNMLFKNVFPYQEYEYFVVNEQDTHVPKF